MFWTRNTIQVKSNTRYGTVTILMLYHPTRAALDVQCCFRCVCLVVCINLGPKCAISRGEQNRYGWRRRTLLTARLIKFYGGLRRLMAAARGSRYMRSSANFRIVSPTARTPAHWMPSSDQILTQNDHSRSFKVIRFGVNEKPLRGYIVQYNCGLECEDSEDIASERSENRHLRPHHSHLTPLSSKPPRIST